MCFHNCNEIRNKVLLKAEQNFYFRNKTIHNYLNQKKSSHNFNEIWDKILLKTEQIFYSE